MKLRKLHAGRALNEICDPRMIAEHGEPQLAGCRPLAGRAKQGRRGVPMLRRVDLSASAT